MVAWLARPGALGGRSFSRWLPGPERERPSPSGSETVRTVRLDGEKANFSRRVWLARWARRSSGVCQRAPLHLRRARRSSGVTQRSPLHLGFVRGDLRRGEDEAETGVGSIVSFGRSQSVMFFFRKLWQQSRWRKHGVPRDACASAKTTHERLAAFRRSAPCRAAPFATLPRPPTSRSRRRAPAAGQGSEQSALSHPEIGAKGAHKLACKRCA